MRGGARPASACGCDVLGRSPAFELDGERVGVSTRGAAGRLSTCDGDVTGLLQGPDMRDDITVGHLQRVSQFREREFGSGREKGHNSEASFFVDDLVKLEKGLRVHGRAGGWDRSVARK